MPSIQSLSSVLNSLGLRLATSKPLSNFVVGTGLSVSINGTNGDDALISYGGGSTVFGGLGDDTYYTWDPTDVVVELPGQGVDTVFSFGWHYTLPANVENLDMPGAGTYGYGNSLDNIIVSEAGGQIVDGGAGNDVLISSGSGSDTFDYERGSGQDAIIGFKAGIDHINFDVSLPQFTSFATVQAAMTQSGPDVVLNLGAGDLINFRNHLIADFSAADFVLPVNFGALHVTFDDEFNTFAASASGLAAASGKPVWQSQYEFWPGYGMRTLAPGNPEVEYYSDASVGVSPFTDINGRTEYHRRARGPGQRAHRPDAHIGNYHHAYVVQSTLRLLRTTRATAFRSGLLAIILAASLGRNLATRTRRDGGIERQSESTSDHRGHDADRYRGGSDQRIVRAEHEHRLPYLRR